MTQGREGAAKGRSSKGEGQRAEEEHKKALALAAIVGDPVKFSRYFLQRPMRRYQEAPAQAIVRAVREGHGGTFVVMMSRQAGKNELSAHLEADLLTMFSTRGGQIVKASPTFKPQTITSRDRLRELLQATPLADMTRPAAGYQIHLGRASAHFLATNSRSKVVGATASILLECDEAQDVDPEKWDKDFVPMTASTNAVRVMWGTAWTKRTLLYREMVAAQGAERRDGRRRVFAVDYREVSEEVPAYRAHVQEQLRRLGAEHPLFLTQYGLQTIDEVAGFIPAHRQQVLQGLHEPHDGPRRGCVYAFALDVGGGAEQSDPNAEDWTALTIAEVAATQELPVYQIVARRAWQGANQPALYDALMALIAEWRPTAIAVDGSGLGLGLAQRLGASHPGLVHPTAFNPAAKSALGWQLVAAIDAMRLRDHRRGSASTKTHEDARMDGERAEPGAPCPSAPSYAFVDRPSGDALQEAFWAQVEACAATYGANRSIDWGVPLPAHDDLLVSAALLTSLDAHVGGPAGFEVVKARGRTERPGGAL